MYCVAPARASLNLNFVGINGEQVSAVRFKELVAIVSNSTEKTYEILDHGISHQKVIESTATNSTVLPLAFGQVTTEEDVRAFLSANYAELLSTMDRFSGKVELGLKVTWKMQSILSEIARSSEPVKALKTEMNSRPQNLTYQKRIELGRLVREQLEKMGKRITSEILETLGPLASESKVNDPLRDEMVLNAAFLVEATKEDKFDAAVNAIERRIGELVSLKYIKIPAIQTLLT